MGIFDTLQNMGNLNPEQTQGLLGAAAQLLQAGGPSRTPTSFGQALGAGLEGYQGGSSAYRKQKQDELQAAQIAKLTGLRIQDAESDFTNQAATRDRAEQLRQFYIKNGGGGPTSSQSSGGAMPAASIDSGEFFRAAASYGLPTDNESLNKIVGLVNQGGMSPVQAAASLAGKSSPTAENAGLMQNAIPQLPQMQSTGAPAQKPSLYEQRIAQSQALRNAGFGPEADAAETAALKFQPKVKEWKEVRVGDQILYAPYFEDGTPGQPVPLEIARKLEARNTGGSTDMIDPYTGKVSSSVRNTQSPESAARIAVDIRGQDLTNARGIEANAIARDRASVEKAPTEFQGKSAAFGLRAEEANKKLNELNGQYSPAKINSKQSVGETWLVGGALEAATNYSMSPKDQQAEQAQRDFVNAVLRQESGAAIGVSEFKNAQRQYFPQPGDGQDVIKQKARDRALSVQALQANAGRAKLQAPAGEGDHAPAAPPAGARPPSGNFSVAAPNGKTYSFNTAKDLANFKLSAGIK